MKEYCVNNEIFELHICSGHDKLNFNIILKKIKLIFKETHVKIFITKGVNEINTNNNCNILAEINEKDIKSNPIYTVHSNAENELNKSLSGKEV